MNYSKVSCARKCRNFTVIVTIVRVIAPFPYCVCDLSRNEPRHKKTCLWSFQSVQTQNQAVQPEKVTRGLKVFEQRHEKTNVLVHDLV